jgi:soluble lytic murein transglycosylase
MWTLRICLLGAALTAMGVSMVNTGAATPVAHPTLASGEMPIPYADTMPMPVPVSIAAPVAAAPLSTLPPATPIDPLVRQRIDFKLAWDAASSGDMVTLAPYLETLKGYPLYPYLRYAYLEATLDRIPDGLVEQFLQENATLPIADKLRRDWVIAAAKRQDWAAVIDNYRDEGDLGQRCAIVSAHILGSQADAAIWSDAAKRLWMTSGAPRDVCQPLFDYMDGHGLISLDMRHKRVQDALMARDYVTAAALAPGLDVDDRGWAQQWLAMAADPAGVLADIQVPDEPRYQEMLQSGVKLLARTAPNQALHLWTALSKQYHFSHDDARDMRTLLAMQHAWHLLPDARAELKGLHDSVDPQVPEWRARLALRDGDWKEALRDINGLGARNEMEWRYWRARCLEELGHSSEAKAIYRELARTPDYYGFLSADRLHVDYRIVQQPSRPAREVIEQLESRPGFERARELVYAGLYPQADAEWNLASRNLSGPARCQAALMAQHWGWYAKVIPALASGGCWQDLSLTYPIAFQDTLEPQAKKLSMDISWIYGLIRQESVFRPNAVSAVGALGLMQLMPATGRAVGERMGVTLDDRRALLDPETNLTVGSEYLNSLLHRFDGSEPLATAAYNAGENRVDDWLPEAGTLPADVWIDTIPYTETRNYVHHVMAHTVFFDWRLHGKPERLSQRIGEIAAAAAATAGATLAPPAQPTVAKTGKQ